jgi:hypothetical protein
MKHTITAKELIDVISILKSVRDNVQLDMDMRIAAARLCGGLGYTLEQVIKPIEVEIEGVPV